MWTENTTKTGSKEKYSIKVSPIQRKNEDSELIVFKDNSGGQNKNWLVVTLAFTCQRT